MAEVAPIVLDACGRGHNGTERCAGPCLSREKDHTDVACAPSRLLVD